MFDRVLPMRPRVALVFGDAAAAAHLRDAVADQVEIVYATSAAEFDASRLSESGVSAALVNLDNCDWLDAIEASLNAAGIAVVFNDPEISRNLQGWEQARWLRHLTAKLSGNTHYDPPRPVADAMPVRAAQVPAEPMADASVPPIVDAPDVAERPLSAAEIESMTADFVTVQEPSMAAPNRDDDVSGGAQAPLADAGGRGEMPVATAREPDMAPAALTGTAVAAPSGLQSPHAEASVANLDHPGALDVDTEALSAMIDARLAEPDKQASLDSPQVWRVVDAAAVAAADAAITADAVSVPEPIRPAAPPVNDADVTKGLPALDDWQLVDPEASVVQVADAQQEKRPEPASSFDFSGLELVPMETIVPRDVKVEPVERWMGASPDEKAVAEKSKPATPRAGGGRA